MSLFYPNSHLPGLQTHLTAYFILPYIHSSSERSVSDAVLSGISSHSSQTFRESGDLLPTTRLSTHPISSRSSLRHWWSPYMFSHTDVQGLDSTMNLCVSNLVLNYFVYLRCVPLVLWTLPSLGQCLKIWLIIQNGFWINKRMHSCKELGKS